MAGALSFFRRALVVDQPELVMRNAGSTESTSLRKRCPLNKTWRLGAHQALGETDILSLLVIMIAFTLALMHISQLLKNG